MIVIFRRRELQDYLKIGLIQTVIDGDLAWGPPDLRMHPSIEDGVWCEIKKGFRSLNNCGEPPQLIILPELSIPHGYHNDLIKLARSTGAVVIAGMDFETVGPDKVMNRAIIVVPQNWPEPRWSRNAKVFFFGKTFFSEEEKKLFTKYNPQYTPLPDPTTYIIEAGPFGNIGVAICSDIFDIDRFVVYKGRIHHMIVISHNQDTLSFYYLAEAIARLIYCNVVICNTGYFGDTLVFSPYREAYKRTIYRHEGAGLFSSQVVNLPVNSLESAQKGLDTDNLYKKRPPGYPQRV